MSPDELDGIISVKRPYKPSYGGVFRLTRHVERQMSRRRISRKALAAVLKYGDVYRTPGTVVYIMRRKDVLKWKKKGFDLSEYENIQVTVSADDAHIITVYRSASMERKKRTVRSSRRRAVIEAADSPPQPPGDGADGGEEPCETEEEDT